MLLRDKVAVITGARTGIGKAMALAFAREGAKVVVNDRAINEADEVITDIRAMGGEVLGFSADVGDRDQVFRMAETARRAFGSAEILVNNAGISRPAMLHKMSEEEWDEVIRVHLKGTFNCIQAFVGDMIGRGSGAIINVTSSAGLTGTVGQVNYSAAKAGIVGLTKSAARELARHNITVNAISPLAVTSMTKTITTDPRFKDKYLDRIPLGRFAAADEIAPTVVFLASDQARYITGQIVCIDGGMVM